MNIKNLLVFTAIISIGAIVSDAQCSDYGVNNHKYTRNKKVVDSDKATSSSDKSINSDDNYYLLQDDHDNDIEENYEAPISYGQYHHKYHEVSNEMDAPSLKNYKHNNHEEFSVSAFSAAPLPKRSNHSQHTTQVLSYDAASPISYDEE